MSNAIASFEEAKRTGATHKLILLSVMVWTMIFSIATHAIGGVFTPEPAAYRLLFGHKNTEQLPDTPHKPALVKRTCQHLTPPILKRALKRTSQSLNLSAPGNCTPKLENHFEDFKNNYQRNNHLMSRGGIVIYKSLGAISLIGESKYENTYSY